MIYHFEWDPLKARSNFTKHNVYFEQATEIFTDPLALSIYDQEHSFGEDRWITIGKTNTEKIIVVVHTFMAISKSDFVIRIISARRATKNEKMHYHGDHL